MLYLFLTKSFYYTKIRKKLKLNIIPVLHIVFEAVFYESRFHFSVIMTLPDSISWKALFLAFVKTPKKEIQPKMVLKKYLAKA